MTRGLAEGEREGSGEWWRTTFRSLSHWFTHMNMEIEIL